MICKSTTIKDSKGLLGRLPTLKADVPEFVFIATDNARCPGSEVYVKEGDPVYIGQVLGMRDGGFFKQPIHSTVSGTFDGYEEHYHRSGKKTRFMRLKNDHQDIWDPSLKPRSDEEIAKILLNAMKKDKKNSSSKIRFILQSNVGETVITEVPEEDILSVLK